MFAVIILLVDIIFALVDPRIRSQYVGKGKRKRGKQLEKEAKKVQAV
jgi:hypothetical protein